VRVLDAAAVPLGTRQTSARTGTRRAARLVRIAGVVLVAVGVAVWRAGQAQPGLTYPDAYQYLMMARGIATHLQPVIRMGPGGDLFVPNSDAALKPLYPAIVAALHAVTGAGFLSAARLVNTLAAASVIVAAGLVAARLGGGRIGGVTSAGLVLVSPSVGYWFAFVGPDALACGLVLAAVYTATTRRPTLAGILAGLAISTRPEYTLILVTLGLASLARPNERRDAERVMLAAIGTTSVIFGVIRPPISLPATSLVAAAVIVVMVAAGLITAARAGGRVARWVQILLPAAAAMLVAAGWFGGYFALRTTIRHDVVIGITLVLCVAYATFTPRLRDPVSMLALVGVLLGGVYYVKNPGVDRYLAPLVVLAAIIIGIAAGDAARRLIRHGRLVTIAAASVTLAIAVTAPTLTAGPDMFSAIAVAIPAGNQPLLTAAPDAYAFRLPDRPIRYLTPGEEGLVLLDATQRVAAPTLRACGPPISVISSDGFQRPDGTIDNDPAVIAAGPVSNRTGTCP
jgi:hypothetical protein